MLSQAKNASFPSYDMLERHVGRAEEKTRKLERLYHQTQAHGWDPRSVLDELEARHGGVRLPEHLKEPVAHVFSVLLWGELAAWNIAADLSRSLPDIGARMAAAGQAFDEARHFSVLRDYLARAGVEPAPLNPYGKLLLEKILDTDSTLQKLYGMQLLVENLALAIFRRLEEEKVEPVLTELLSYIERDESRHVALGVMYLPRLLESTTPLERARNWAFNVELFVLTVASGQLLDQHLSAMGVDHRELGLQSFRLHEQIIRQMAQEQGLAQDEKPRGVYGIEKRHHMRLVDFLHPDRPASELSLAHRRALSAFDSALRGAAKFLS